LPRARAVDWNWPKSLNSPGLLSSDITRGEQFPNLTLRKARRNKKSRTAAEKPFMTAI
jgi:hypothetical protein